VDDARLWTTGDGVQIVHDHDRRAGQGVQIVHDHGQERGEGTDG